MKPLSLLVLFFAGIQISVADVKGTSGDLLFYPSYNGPVRMILNPTGLSIGSTSGSANLSVSGNAIVATTLTVGAPTMGSSNLNVYGTIGYGIERVSSNAILSGNSMVLVDTSASGGNIVLKLPTASTVPGRIYDLKKISTNHTVTVLSDFGIDHEIGYDLYANSSNILPHFKVISSGNHWYILNGSTFRGPPTTGGGNLVSWWKFDETSGTTASESSGYGTQGTLMGSLTFSGCTMLGRKGKALSFDGVGDYVTCNSTLGATLTSNFTVMAWIKQSTTVGVRRIASCSQEVTYNGWTFGVNAGGVLFTTCGVKDYGGTYAFSVDQWYHVAVVYGSSNDANFYVNGSFLQTGTHTVPMNANTDDKLLIGIWTNRASECFVGLIDDVRIYNKALTASEISLIYNVSY